VIAEAAERAKLVAVHHATPHGRSAAANAGAAAASGEVLLFLDGDTLAGPGTVAAHAALHEGAGREVVGRGHMLHLRGTKFLRDPQTATPWPGDAARLARLPPHEIDSVRVTAAQVTGDFDAIARRAQPGVYPGAGPRRLAEIETDALRNHPDCDVLWAAATGSNFSVRRDLFRASGGFRPELDINEHRELALRLCRLGARMVLVEQAACYHLTHRSGWRDPLREWGWEDVFLAAHPIPAVKLLAVFWASLADRSVIPECWRILSLPDLAAAARGERAIDIDAARRLLRPELAAA
jgi:GT2 family glycosyltransferase